MPRSARMQLNWADTSKGGSLRLSPEDELIAAWKRLCDQMPQVSFARQPGFTATYSGLSGKPRSSSFN
jgi:hypothetical protein